MHFNAGVRPMGKRARLPMVQRFWEKTISFAAKPLDMKLQYSKINVVVDHTELVAI